MNSSEFSLYGMCPFYDQTILVHCHICKFITKISQLADHLLKRHGISNTDQLDELAARLEATATIDNEQTNSKSLSNNELKQNGNDKQSGKVGKRGAAKANKKQQQQPSLSTSMSTSALPTATIQPIMPPPALPPPTLSNPPVIAKCSSLPSEINILPSKSAKTPVTTSSTVASSITKSSAAVVDPPSMSADAKIENEAKLKYVVEKIKSKLNSAASSGNASSNSSNGNNNNKQSNKQPIAQTDQPTISLNTKSYTTGAQQQIQQSIKSETIDTAAKKNGTYAPKIIKTYDPDKHCGVVTESIDPTTGEKVLSEPCLRSLTCKKHSISARRQVVGRSKHFNELFKAYRDEKLTTTGVVGGIASSKSGGPHSDQAESPQKLKSPLAASIITNEAASLAPTSKQISPSSTRVNREHQFQPIVVTQTSQPAIAQHQSLNLNYMNMQVVKHHPRPSGVTSFNARLTDYGGGYALWNRRQDNLRHVLTDCFMKNPKVLRKNASFIYGEMRTNAQMTTEKFKNGPDESMRNGNLGNNMMFKQHQKFSGDVVKQLPSDMLKTSMNGADSLMFAPSSFISSDELDEDRSGSGVSTIGSRKRNHHYDSADFDQLHHMTSHHQHQQHHNSSLLSPSALKMPKLDELLSLNMIESDAIQDYTDARGVVTGGHEDEEAELNYLYSTSDTNRLVVGETSTITGPSANVTDKHTHHNLSSLSLSPSPSSSSSSNSSSSSTNSISLMLCSNNAVTNKNLRHNGHHNHHQFNAAQGSTSILN